MNVHIECGRVRLGNVVRLPEPGFRVSEVREQPCDVVRLSWWRFVFRAQTLAPNQIWTDPAQEQEIIAPGQMTVDEAREWAKQRVPDSYLLVQCFREFGDNHG